MPGDGEDVEIGAVAVGLFVSADRHLRGMGMAACREANSPNSRARTITTHLGCMGLKKTTGTARASDSQNLSLNIATLCPACRHLNFSRDTLCKTAQRFLGIEEHATD